MILSLSGGASPCAAVILSADMANEVDTAPTTYVVAGLGTTVSLICDAMDGW